MIKQVDMVNVDRVKIYTGKKSALIIIVKDGEEHEYSISIKER